jgi:hypothetical protein
MGGALSRITMSFLLAFVNYILVSPAALAMSSNPSIIEGVTETAI